MRRYVAKEVFVSNDDLKKWWIDIEQAELDIFIKYWFAEIDKDEEGESPYSQDVVLMNFLADDDFQWKFIKRSFELAYDAEHLTTLAAGPVEHLLGFHGEKWIETIERESKLNDNFAWMMTGVWQHKMSDDVWARVQNIQATVEE